MVDKRYCKERRVSISLLVEELSCKEAKKMDKTTLGSSLAAKNLIEILNKTDNKTSNKICFIINIFRNTLKELSSIINYRTRNRMFLLYRRDTFNSIDSLDTSKETKTFIKNVLTAIYRKAVKESNKS